MNRTTTKSLIAISLLFILSHFPVLSQNSTQDPLNKPDLWKKITKTPQDMRLWAAYVGKDLNSLTAEDEEKIVNWCSNIKADFENNLLSEDIWMDVAKNHHYDRNQKVQMDLEYKIFHKQVEKHILTESPVLKDLQSNIETNFIIIEDIIRLEFEELGTKFIDYAATYPKHDFPKDKWIEEKNSELVELKLLKLEILKAQASK